MMTGFTKIKTSVLGQSVDLPRSDYEIVTFVRQN